MNRVEEIRGYIATVSYANPSKVLMTKDGNAVDPEEMRDYLLTIIDKQQKVVEAAKILSKATLVMRGEMSEKTFDLFCDIDEALTELDKGE